MWLWLNATMPDQLSPSQPVPNFTHRSLERLTAAKTHLWMLRQRVRASGLEAVAAAARLDHIERQVDEAAALAANVRGQSSPPLQS